MSERIVCELGFLSDRQDFGRPKTDSVENAIKNKQLI